VQEEVLKNIGDKEKGDNMTEKSKIKHIPKSSLGLTDFKDDKDDGFEEILAKSNTPHGKMQKNLVSGYLHYDVKQLLKVLSKFAFSPEGASARVILILPDGRNPMQKEFNIKEIRLVDNKIIGADEKHRCAILVQ